MRTKLAVVGASGRMGQAVIRLARESDDFEVACEVSEGDDFSAVERAHPAIAIDFSRPTGTRALAEIAARSGVALVVGTTGLDEAAERSLNYAAKRVAVFSASNMSVGVHVLGALAARAAKMLGDEFDVEIVEAHHRRKVDAPSGTALTLAKILQDVRGGETALKHGRAGHAGARGTHEIGLHAVRGGDVVGDHSIFFFGDGEQIELTHRASNRDLFARGALRAARWLVDKSPGIYGMRDMLSEI